MPIAQADLLDPTATPGVGPLVVLAAVRGEDLHVEGPVDARMAAGAPQIMATLVDWWGLPPLAVEVDDVYDTPADGDGGRPLLHPGRRLVVDPARPARRAARRSGHAPRLGAPGLDDPGRRRGRDPRRPPRGRRRVRAWRSSRWSPRPRPCSTPIARWMDTVVPALTGTGLQVAGRMRRLVLTTDHPVHVHRRTGVDPDLVGPLRTGRTEVVAGNLERTRAQRIAHLLGSPLARRSLQVCWEAGTAGNCGRCSKCLITMAGLAMAGDPDPAAGFAAPIDPDHVRQVALRPEMAQLVTPIIEGLPPAYEELRRAWSDAWDRANGRDPPSPLGRRMPHPPSPGPRCPSGSPPRCGPPPASPSPRHRHRWGGVRGPSPCAPRSTSTTRSGPWPTPTPTGPTRGRSSSTTSATAPATATRPTWPSPWPAITVPAPPTCPGSCGLGSTLRSSMPSRCGGCSARPGPGCGGGPTVTSNRCASSRRSSRAACRCR